MSIAVLPLGKYMRSSAKTIYLIFTSCGTLAVINGKNM